MTQAKLRRDVAQRTAPPDRIGTDDASYLARVREQAAQAARLEQEAAQLDQRAADLRRQALLLYGAHESFVAFLCEKHELDPKADQIDPLTGRITRAPTLDLSDLGEAEVVGAPAENGKA